MELTVEQSCPSCGAAIIGDEADRLLQCAFCGIHHYRVNPGLSRFVLPDKAPKHIRREDFFTRRISIAGGVFFPAMAGRCATGWLILPIWGMRGESRACRHPLGSGRR